MTPMLDYRFHTAVLIREDQLHPAHKPEIRHRQTREPSVARLPRRWRRIQEV